MALESLVKYAGLEIKKTPILRTAQEISQNALQMTLEEFEKANLAVRVRSRMLGEDLYVVSNRKKIEEVKREGLVVYLPAEIRFMENMSSKGVQRIHKIKKRMDAELIRQEKDCDALSEQAGST